MSFNPRPKIAAVLGIAASVISLSALADSTNTITFKGEVSEQTCEVTINGVTARPVVLLPTISKSQLASADTSAGLTTFTLGVTGCAVTSGALDVKTVFVGNNVSATGNLENTGSATNVELQLLTDAGGATPVDLRTSTAIAGVTVPAGQTSGEHDFAVQYYSPTGSATAGTVLGSVQYAVTYL